MLETARRANRVTRVITPRLIVAAAVILLTHGNSHAGDFDGDGDEDLFVGSPLETIEADTVVMLAGAASLIRGTPDGLQPNALAFGFPWPYFTEDDLGLESAVNEQFGQRLAFGDFDCDGDDEIAIGIPLERNADGVLVDGAVVVLAAIEGSPPAVTEIRQPTLGFTQEVGPLLGDAVLAGAFDPSQPTCDSLVIGASRDREFPGIGPPVGAVYLVPGSPSGLQLGAAVRFLQGDPGVGDLAENNDMFGKSLAAADVDADGLVDLVVGAPGEEEAGEGLNFDSGAVHIVFGCSTGLGQCQPGLVLTEQSPEGVEEGDRLGEVLATGDFDSDGVSDLVIGIPSEDIFDGTDVLDAGAVDLILGPITGPPGLGDELILFNDCALTVAGCPRASSRFGADVLLADLDPGRSGDELVVASPGYPGIPDQDSPPHGGWVHVLTSSIFPRDLVITKQSFAPDSLTVATAGGFGTSLAAGDFNADGLLDLVIGEPTGDTFDADDNFVQAAGVVHVIPGDEDRGVCLYCDGYDGSVLSFSQGDLFGAFPETLDGFGQSLSR